MLKTTEKYEVCSESRVHKETSMKFIATKKQQHAVMHTL
jgi:hypothetical protein